jgi:membrane-bound lytic murein transglycosylase B
MKSGRALLKYSVAAICASTLVGCGSAPVSDTAPETSNTLTTTVPESAPLEQAEVPTTEEGVIAAPTKSVNANKPNNTNTAQRQAEALKQQRMAELEAKRMGYHQRWVAEQQRQSVAKQQPSRPIVRPTYVQPRKVSIKSAARPPASNYNEAYADPVGGQGSGNYYAASVGGSFAGQPAVLNLVERLARKGFDRGYLYGVFSQAQYREDVAQIWAKYYAKGGEDSKPKATGGGGGYPSYRGKFLTAGNIAKGRNFWNRYSSHLARAEQQYGVPAEYIVGIMGVETRWGEILGKHRILDALLTSAVAVPHRANFFLSEAENFMMMTRSERMDPLTPKGSYAGAMGYGQFMPSSFQSYAVDFDGDGIRDIWNPVDAIGSIANYFAKHGWRAGESVVVPANVSSNNYYSMPDGFKTKYSLGNLAQNGIVPAQPYRASGKAHLLALSHDGGKAPFIGFNNFYVITRYNHSNYYAMAVHELGNTIKQGVGAIYAQR